MHLVVVSDALASVRDRECAGYGHVCQAEELSNEQVVEVTTTAASGTQPSEPTLPETSSRSAFNLFLKAIEICSVAKPWPEEGDALFARVVAAAKDDSELSHGSRRVLELMCHSCCCNLEARSLLGSSDDALFNAFLAVARKSTGAPAGDLAAVRERQCTGKLYPRWARPQIGFVCVDCDATATICAHCFLEEHADHKMLDGMSGLWTTFVCKSLPSKDRSSEGSVESQELVKLARDVAQGDFKGIESASSAVWPRHWTRLLAHLGEMNALHASGDGKSLPVSLLKIGALRDLYFPSPPLKLKHYGRHNGDPSRLVLLLHGAMSTEKHCDYMQGGIFGGSSTSDIAVVGIEADYVHDLGNLLGAPDMVGFSFERPYACMSRYGEYICAAVRIYKQVLESWLDRYPNCKSVDIVSFSSGGMVAWLLFCMMPQKADWLAVRTLSLMSPRLEEHLLIADNVAKGLLNNRVHVFIAYGEEEDLPADGSPMSALASSFRRWMPSRQTPGLRVKAYPKQGHVMTFPLLKDVKGFLDDAWQRKS